MVSDLAWERKRLLSFPLKYYFGAVVYSPPPTTQPHPKQCDFALAMQLLSPIEYGGSEVVSALTMDSEALGSLKPLPAHLGERVQGWSAGG